MQTQRLTTSRPFVVSIEGNIGSGKSTMLQHFAKLSDVQVHPEPVDKWLNLRGHNLLELLYADPKRWSFQFQSYIQLTRLQILKAPSTKGIKLIERSIQNNRFCFLELAKRCQTLEQPELAVLHSWFEWLDETMQLDLDLIVYLRTQPEVAFERMKKRAREEEDSTSLNYLSQVHQAYEDWLIHQRQGTLDIPVLVLDASKGIQDMKKLYSHYQDFILGKRGLEPGIIYAKDDVHPNDFDRDNSTTNNP